MNDKQNLLYQNALSTLHNACTPDGILALVSDEIQENYNRIWARDSIMTGISGIYIDDNILSEGLRSSLFTLQKHQTIEGIIPSNVSMGDNQHVSYGGTAGRVDATLWYIIGVLMYYDYSKDSSFLSHHKNAVLKAMQVCQIWEFNNKNLIYTPLSGNWADEYPIHGYTLYDNVLRLWGLELYAKIFSENKDEKLLEKINAIRTTLTNNYFLDLDNENAYNPLIYKKYASKDGLAYMAAGFNPSRYFMMFDAGGNGLAMMLGLFTEDQVDRLEKHLNSIFKEIDINMSPAFWPTIQLHDDLYHDLETNYAYHFKNHPFHFHNGGIWPIMNGWLAKGFSHYRRDEICKRILTSYIDICESENYAFSEYISSDKLKPGGKSKLSFSATGSLLMLNNIKK